MFWLVQMAETALPVFILRIASPAVVFIAALSILASKPIHDHLQPSPITSVVVATTIPRRAAILSFLSLAALTYLGDGLVFVVFSVISKQWPRQSGIPINTVVGLAAFSGLAAVGAWKDVAGVPVWFFKRIKTAVATSLLLDIALAALIGVELRDTAHIPESRLGLQALLHFAFLAFRVVLLFPLLASLLSPRITYSPVPTTEEQAGPTNASSFLLPPDGSHQHSGLSTYNAENGKYGTFRTTRPSDSSAPPTRATTPAQSTAPDRFEPKQEISLEPTWSELFARIRRLTPYLWPSNNRHLQFVAFLCILILVLGRVINVALPLTLGKLVHALEEGSGSSPWPYLFGYVGLRYLQGSGGLSAIRDALWAPVMQYSDRAMSQLAFDHILNLSFAWHTRRKTGEILRVLDRGAAINHTFELILFNIIPTFVDIFIALVAFVILFEWPLALVIFFVMFSYVAASVILTQYRTRLRRQMNDRDVITRGIHTDILLNYETVKYFGGEDHEGERYRNAMREYQQLELKVILSLNLLNLVQNFIITVGLLVGSLIVTKGVVEGRWGASEFVIFITYLAQLYGPLNQLGYTYRSVNQSLVDTERLLALLNEPTDINDGDDAPDLAVTAGEIEFRNVTFSYDERSTALNQISFKVPKGSSVALVGESGSGKSTILRLLYRFYDLKSGDGSILIDGQDIRDVTQKSLRHAIGVVPQDPVLFNSTVSYNIGYGKIGSSQEEIEEVARSAQMHDRILTFPDGYETKVGERGVRLSGGEKQRVAIARTLLKNPPILLLDEATSALDTSTEKDIQKALQNLVKGRSSLSIAHRLSTIASADLILVLKDGQIIEQGTHKELLALDGVFASMWADQVSSSDPISRKSSFRKEDNNAGSSVKDEDLIDLSQISEVKDLEEVQERSVEVESPIEVETSPKEVKSDDKPAEEAPQEAPAPQTLAQVVAFPSGDPEDEEVAAPPRSSPSDGGAKEEVIAPEPVSAVPIAFPASDSASVISRQEAPSQTPASSPPVPMAVTFEAVSPPRTGTPDPDAEPKRKRTASQNFQRLARRISLTTRRQGSVSSIIPVLKRDQSPRVSVDEGSSRGEGSSITAVMTDSPAPSVKGEDKESKPKLKKKDKKGNRKSLLG
ncbi:mitochondrial half-size ABC transporter [Coprinopsis marcescibilis]|uniref:Mitochondrial half-size ABC transporter n=1 Tax=Coprinopsis marcescibilis TaxID=230819 RepID=A0A5C3KZ74_COPMA|nr:mitochondrial half-size ABC transporter [Coprinopsis marcescibilis]